MAAKESVSWSNVGATVWPLVINYVIFAVMLVWHLWEIKHVRLQALYIRALFLFPLASSISYLGGVSLYLLYWTDLLIGFIEAYIFALFLGLLLTWASHHGPVERALVTSKFTNKRFYFLRKGMGKSLNSAEEVLFNLRWQVYQFAVIKPGLSLIKAIYFQVAADSLPLGAGLVLAVVQIISIVIALRALLNLYFCCKAFKAEGEDETCNLLLGLRAFLKFTIVKATVFFLVFNSLIIFPLVQKQLIKVPSIVCPSDILDTYPLSCGEQTVIFIFLVESVILMLLAASTFTPKDFDVFHEDLLDQKSAKRELLLRFLMFWDVYTSFCRLKALEEIELKREKSKGTSRSSNSTPFSQASSNESSNKSPSLDALNEV